MVSLVVVSKGRHLPFAVHLHHQQGCHGTLNWSPFPLLQQVDVVDLLHLLLVGLVVLVGHRANLFEDCEGAMPLGKQFAVRRCQEEQNLLARLKYSVCGLLVIPLPSSAGPHIGRPPPCPSTLPAGPSSPAQTGQRCDHRYRFW